MLHVVDVVITRWREEVVRHCQHQEQGQDAAYDDSDRFHGART
jgi:hypothetical protein